MTNLSGTNLNNGAAVGPQGESRESPSSFPAYPTYKDSGVEWLGEIPGHWAVFIAKRMFGNVRESASADAEQLAATQAYGVIPQKDFMERNDAKVVLALSGTENFRAVKANDFVISLRSFQGGIEHSAYDGCVSPAYTVLRRKDERNLNPSYLRYLFKDASYISALQSVTTGIREGRTITYEQFGSLSMPVAPVAEQTQIARFLDHETARIDALIEEQQRLIELLKEKRQAVISHAVTKGLDPTVPMKDSGVEWLGEVPAHWDVLRIGAVYSETADKGLTELPVLRVSIHYGVSDKELSEEEADRKITRIDDREKYKRVRPGDLVYNMMRAWQGGFGAVLVDGLVSPAYVVARPKNGDISRYVEQLLRTSCAIEEMRKNSYGITDFRLRLYWDQFKNIFISIPPEVERQQIMERIDSLINESEALKSEADRLIVILQERRSALISAAVTGKIDVRGWQPPASIQAPEPAVAEAV